MFGIGRHGTVNVLLPLDVEAWGHFSTLTCRARACIDDWHRRRREWDIYLRCVCSLRSDKAAVNHRTSAAMSEDEHGTCSDASEDDEPMAVLTGEMFRAARDHANATSFPFPQTREAWESGAQGYADIVPRRCSMTFGQTCRTSSHSFASCSGCTVPAFLSQASATALHAGAWSSSINNVLPLNRRETLSTFPEGDSEHRL